jgi:alpha-1,3-rhamnosyl/mannosyltransferase
MEIALGVESLLSPKLTGVGHYTRQLLLGLQSDSSLHINCIANGRVISSPFATPTNNNQRRDLVGWLKKTVITFPGARYARTQQLSRGLRRQIGSAIYHEPNHILRLSRPPTVVSVLDLSVIHYPEFHPRERVKYFERYFSASSTGADLIITPSEFTRRDLIQTLALDPAKIRVVPMGVDEKFKPLSAPNIVDVLRPYELIPGRYILALGTREPRKNLERLLDAYLALPSDLRKSYKLILVGPSGWQAQALERRIAALTRDGTLRSLGYVPDDARPALYNGAAAFAYPALYEGFGLPPLEALACGRPVLTSHNSPMAEMLGGFVDLVDPLDVPAITQGLAGLLTDPTRRQRAQQDGARHAATFRWQACVERTIAVYRELESRRVA